MTSKPPTVTMPAALKVFFSVAALCGLVIAAGVIFSGAIGFTLAQQSHDPHLAGKMAHELLVIADPLPKGWEYLGGTDLFANKSTSMVNDKSKTVVGFRVIPNQYHQTAEKLVERMNVKNNVGTFQATEVGSAAIGGQQMYYRRGTTHSSSGVIPTQMGIIVLPGDRAVIVNVNEIGAKTYDAQVPQQLFDQIKAFRQSGN